MASIRKLPSGRYRVRWRDHDGHEQGVTAPTKKAALELKASTENALFRGVHRDPRAGKQPLGPYLSESLDTSTNLRPATLALYRTEATRYVLPSRLGSMPLVAIEASDLRRLYADLLKNGTGKPTVEVVHRLISRVLNQAVDDGLITSNPAARAKAPRAERKPVRVLQPANAIWLAVILENFRQWGVERVRWLQDPGGEGPATVHNIASERRSVYDVECGDDWRRLGYFSAKTDPALGTSYGVMALLGMFAGLRFGEAAALRPSHVRFGAEPRVEVTEALSESAGVVEIGPTKTKGSRRAVPIPKRVADVIAPHVETTVRERGSDALLFVTAKGLPLSRTRFAARVWKPAVMASGITPPPTFHHLRHSFAAWQIAQGAHAKEIQELMGHSSIRTTLDRYGHLMETLESQQHERMDAALRNNGGTHVARRVNIEDPREVVDTR